MGALLLGATGTAASAQTTEFDVNRALQSPAPIGRGASSPSSSIELPRHEPPVRAVGLEAAPPAEAEVNAVIRALSPREAPPPLVLTLASTPFLSRLTVEVVRWTPVTRVRLAPGEVVAAAVPLAPVPVSIAATWPLAPQFGVVVTQTQIAVVEQSSRRVSLVIDKATRIAVGPQARFIFVQDRATLRTIVLDLGASFEQDIAFDHNSSTLSRTARQQLLAMGMALQSPSLSGARFLISGHTNAVGGDLANRELSFRRAVAVREYLSQTFGIASSRIGIHGFGPDRLKYPFDPRHPGNRRVEVALIVGGES